MALVDYLLKECGFYRVKGRRLTFFDAKSMGGGAR
jgi:hypothetical protein